MGRLGYYGPYTLVEIPQRFALNDTTKKLMDPKTLFIMPQVNSSNLLMSERQKFMKSQIKVTVWTIQ